MWPLETGVYKADGFIWQGHCRFIWRPHSGSYIITRKKFFFLVSIYKSLMNKWLHHREDATRIGLDSKVHGLQTLLFSTTLTSSEYLHLTGFDLFMESMLICLLTDNVYYVSYQGALERWEGRSSSACLWQGFVGWSCVPSSCWEIRRCMHPFSLKLFFFSLSWCLELMFDCCNVNRMKKRFSLITLRHTWSFLSSGTCLMNLNQNRK